MGLDAISILWNVALSHYPIALGTIDAMFPFDLLQSHDVKTWRSFHPALVLDGSQRVESG